MLVNIRPILEKTTQAIATLRASIGPVIVGPWLTETGFELLYWIPFLRWAKQAAKLSADRLVVVSRGGCLSWYQDISNRYADIFEFFSVDEFRSMNEQRMLEQGAWIGPGRRRGTVKHLKIGTFDASIVSRVSESCGLRNAQLLHPSLMYNLFRAFWKRWDLTLYGRYTRPAPFARPNRDGLDLPDRYTAVKFYSNQALPDTPENRARVAEIVRAIQGDVVVLNTGTRFDDHADYGADGWGNVRRVETQPETNLDVQTRVIAGATEFIGTYGGFSYLAPLLGVPTRALWSEEQGFRKDHLRVAKKLFASSPAYGAFTTQEIGQA